MHELGEKYWEEVGELQGTIIDDLPVAWSFGEPFTGKHSGRSFQWHSPEHDSVELYEVTSRVMIASRAVRYALACSDGLEGPIGVLKELEFNVPKQRLRVYRSLDTGDYRRMLRGRREGSRIGLDLPEAEDYALLLDELRRGAAEKAVHGVGGQA